MKSVKNEISSNIEIESDQSVKLEEISFKSMLRKTN